MKKHRGDVAIDFSSVILFYTNTQAVPLQLYYPFGSWPEGIVNLYRSNHIRLYPDMLKYSYINYAR